MLKIIQKSILLITILIISSCTYSPTIYSGSKADAIISVSYTTAPALLTAKDWERVDMDANERCKNWGFSNAERFDLGRKVCLVYNAFGCIKWEYYHNYQCID